MINYNIGKELHSKRCMGHNVIAFNKKKKGEILLEPNDTTARFRAVGSTERISVTVKENITFVTFLQYELYE